MTWAATDVHFFRTARGMSAEAKVLFLAVRMYCSERETDGAVSRVQLMAVAEEAEVPDPIHHAATCVKRGLWEKTSDGWLDVGFLAVNPSHEDREKERQRLRDYRVRIKTNEAVQRSRTPYAYTPTHTQTDRQKQDVAMKNNSSVVLETKHPRRRGTGSSQETLGRVHQNDEALIDAEVAEHARENGRIRRGLLARARLHVLAQKPVKGLPARSTSP
jgi:hypothetical protein